MASPDLDDLFGDEPPSAVLPPVPHPALLQTVERLVEEAWPIAKADLCQETEQTEEGVVKKSLNQSTARDFDSAFKALQLRDWSNCKLHAANVRTAAWELLMATGSWPQPCDREVFMLSELLLAVSAAAERDAMTAIAHADHVFVFAAAGRFREAAMLFVQWLDHEARDSHCKKGSRRAADVTIPASLPSSSRLPSAINHLSPLAIGSVEELKQLLVGQRPFIARGFLASWPAKAKWSSLKYLDESVGHRYVPIEIGSNVGTSTWREELVTFSRFLHEYITPSCVYCSSQDASSEFTANIAYLAQHELLEQCPELRKDVAVPDAFLEAYGKPARCNVWFGTHGTMTPCHWDSYDNCLAQVHGFKFVWLVAPDQSPLMYADCTAGKTSAQGNISAVNVESPDFERFPKFRDVTVLTALLEPGDSLFIPQGWWHQVRALSPSISVNFWF